MKRFPRPLILLMIVLAYWILAWRSLPLHAQSAAGPAPTTNGGELLQSGMGGFRDGSILPSDGPKQIGLLWVGKSDMTSALARSFLRRLREIAPSIRVETRMELGDLEIAETFYQHFASEKDGIVFLRNSGARFLRTEQPPLPSFFGGCDAPADDSNPDPRPANATGVTHYLPRAGDFDLITRLLPEARRICLLLDADDPDADDDAAETRAECRHRGLDYLELRCASFEGTLRGIAAMGGETDLFILGRRELPRSQMTELIAAAGDLPVIGYGSPSVEEGALFALCGDDVHLGALLAESVRDVLIRSRSISGVPVKADPSPSLSVSKSACARLGLSLPDDLRATALLLD